MRFSGKVAIVTSGGSGIGEAISQRFASEGAVVIIADLDDTAATRVQGAIAGDGGMAQALQVDVTDAASVASMDEVTLKTHGRIDILVNNAGKRIIKGFMQHSLNDWDEMIRINLTAPFICAQAVLPPMKKAGEGKIINIASIASFVGRPNRCAYVAAKTGLLGLTRAMASDLAGTNIRVNAIAPGMIASPFNAQFAEDSKLGPEWAQDSLVGRWGRPEDIAGVAAFLASDDSDYITGARMTRPLVI